MIGIQERWDSFKFVDRNVVRRDDEVQDIRGCCTESSGKSDVLGEPTRIQEALELMERRTVKSPGDFGKIEVSHEETRIKGENYVEMIHESFRFRDMKVWRSVDSAEGKRSKFVRKRVRRSNHAS